MSLDKNRDVTKRVRIVKPIFDQSNLRLDITLLQTPEQPTGTEEQTDCPGLIQEKLWERNLSKPPKAKEWRRNIFTRQLAPNNDISLDGKMLEHMNPSIQGKRHKHGSSDLTIRGTDLGEVYTSFDSQYLSPYMPGLSKKESTFTDFKSSCGRDSRLPPNSRMNLQKMLSRQPRLEDLRALTSTKELIQIDDTVKSPKEKAERRIEFKIRRDKPKRSNLGQSDVIKKTDPASEQRPVGWWQRFWGLSVKKAEGAKIKYAVGSGNNQRLINKMMKAKEIAFELFFHKANMVWTQIWDRNVSKIERKAGVTVVDLLDPSVTPEVVSEYSISNAQEFVDQINKQNLFRVTEDLVSGCLADGFLKQRFFVALQVDHFTIINHLRGLKYIAKKVLLFETIETFCKASQMDPLSIIPKTYVIRGDAFETDLKKLLTAKVTSEGGFSTPLIIKPGENSNRGQGISMAYNTIDTRTLCEELIESRGEDSNLIIQDYITNPLLFKRRKFDVRCYGLVIKFGTRASYFWYRRGYARTCSFEYQLQSSDNLMIHLTNEAVQVKGT